MLASYLEMIIFSTNSDFFFHFKVFKITNIDCDVNPIYFAANSLLILMQCEMGVMKAASTINPDKMEKKFETMIENATDNYRWFSTSAYDDDDDDLFKTITLTNFRELFELCIDIRKREKILPVVENPAVVTIDDPPVIEPLQKPDESKKRRK